MSHILQTDTTTTTLNQLSPGLPNPPAPADAAPAPQAEPSDPIQPQTQPQPQGLPGFSELGGVDFEEAEALTPFWQPLAGTWQITDEGSQIWRKATGWVVRSSPLVADMDSNGDLEIVIGSDYRTDHKVARLWAWHHDGTVRLAPDHRRGHLLVAAPGGCDR